MIDFYECMKDTYYYIGRVAPFVIRYLFMVIMLLLPLSLYSIQQSPVFRSVTVSEGLSHNTINAIYKDTRGFVWLGTQMGLDRFDGVNVTTYPQFSGRTVFSIGRGIEDRGILFGNCQRSFTHHYRFAQQNAIGK